jgi:hypothetical protein
MDGDPLGTADDEPAHTTILQDLALWVPVTLGWGLGIVTLVALLNTAPALSVPTLPLWTAPALSLTLTLELLALDRV